jgi:hypothetical protein
MIAKQKKRHVSTSETKGEIVESLTVKQMVHIASQKGNEGKPLINLRGFKKDRGTLVPLLISSRCVTKNTLVTYINSFRGGGFFGSLFKPKTLEEVKEEIEEEFRKDINKVIEIQRRENRELFTRHHRLTIDLIWEEVYEAYNFKNQKEGFIEFFYERMRVEVLRNVLEDMIGDHLNLDDLESIQGRGLEGGYIKGQINRHLLLLQGLYGYKRRITQGNIYYERVTDEERKSVFGMYSDAKYTIPNAFSTFDSIEVRCDDYIKYIIGGDAESLKEEYKEQNGVITKYLGQYKTIQRFLTTREEGVKTTKKEVRDEIIAIYEIKRRINESKESLEDMLDFLGEFLGYIIPNEEYNNKIGELNERREGINGKLDKIDQFKGESYVIPLSVNLRNSDRRGASSTSDDNLAFYW